MLGTERLCFFIAKNVGYFPTLRGVVAPIITLIVKLIV